MGNESLSTLFHEQFYPSDPIPSIRRGRRLPWPGGGNPRDARMARATLLACPSSFLRSLAAPSRRGWKRLSKVTRNWVVHGLLPWPIAANDKFRRDAATERKREREREREREEPRGRVLPAQRNLPQPPARRYASGIPYAQVPRGKKRVGIIIYRISPVNGTSTRTKLPHNSSPVF